MESVRKLKGRPSMKAGKRSKKIDARFTEEEYQQICGLETALGVSKTEIIRIRVLNRSSHLIVNAKLMITQLDEVGAELGRSGNNINQLAKYANTMNKRSLLSPQIVERFNILFDQYIRQHQQLEITLRKIIRQMGS
ncbi:MAG TPA: plasmid mobilization relaxosome protein MobC [Pedobacter sp.]|uniref:plasmid mobilization protein n=1 Tax=Pedobacter sp. TaxID=1411316 RepID=UPI002CD19558|nr:plasmid mobilization relaxosome protein MobC [Pedobacter sp.]HMI04871.1 plasmid mobilization relaxosome protein MobC [Pedobacter sp.]